MSFMLIRTLVIPILIVCRHRLVPNLFDWCLFGGAETNRGEKGFNDSVVLMLGGREERGVLEAR